VGVTPHLHENHSPRDVWLVSPEAAAVARANGDFIALAVRDGRRLSLRLRRGLATEPRVYSSRVHHSFSSNCSVRAIATAQRAFSAT
jgi:hypothetical protein